MKKLALLALLTSIGSLRAQDALEPITPLEDPLYYGEMRESNFIIRWQYQDFCDHVYDPRVDVWRWPSNREKGVTFNPEDVKPGDVIFVRMIPKFFKTMHPKITCPYIILTAGEELEQMRESYEEFLDEEKVIAWFGIHPNYMAIAHPKFHPIPLGILQHPSHYFKRDRLHDFFTRLRAENKKDYLLYVNFADNGKPERTKLRKKFVGQPYVKKGSRVEFKEYISQTASACFVLSPAGLGPDCYRNWEALLCGSIPIMKTGPCDKLFEGLPVLIVDDWNILSEEYLREKYKEITAKKYDIAPLYTTYWTNKIKNVQQAFLKTWTPQ